MFLESEQIRQRKEQKIANKRLTAIEKHETYLKVKELIKTHYANDQVRLILSKICRSTLSVLEMH